MKNPLAKLFRKTLSWSLHQEGEGGDWLHDIENPQITFRPIEALINGVEDGVMMKDDYQIKHNLCNVLFGS